jgi:fibronectin-binding autotransporter adhesin
MIAKNNRLIFLAAALAALLAANPAFAAKWTWNGSQGNDHWTNTPNWTPIGPVANDGTADVHFDGSTRLTPDMNANWNVHSLTFDTIADGFTLGSSTGSTLTLGAGGITDNCEIAAGSHTITHAITLSAAQTWSSAGTYGAFSVTGAVNNGGNLLTINTASDDISISGKLSGSGGLTKIGTTTLELTSGTGASNTYSGTTTINAGTLSLGPVGSISTTVIPGLLNVGDGIGTAIDKLLSTANERIANTSTVNLFSTGAWNLNSSNTSETITNLNIVSTGVAGGGLVTTGTGIVTVLGSMTMTGGTVNTTSTGTLSLGGSFFTNSSAITAGISSKLNLGGGARTFTIADGAASNDLDITGLVSNGSIIKEGPGTLRLSAANTYAGGTTLNAGTILIGNDAALGTGMLTGGGGTLRPDGAGRTIANLFSGSLTLDCVFDVTLNNSANLNGNITKNGSGALIFAQPASFDGLTFNVGTVRFDAPITFTGGLTNTTTMLLAAQTPTLTVGGAGLNNQGSFTLAGGTLAIANMTSSGSFVFDSGTLSAIQDGGTISASIVSNTPNTTINVNANNVSIGNPASFTGFNHQGILNVGPNTVTLNSAGFARLGMLTSLVGGTITAPNGVALSTGSNLIGNGAVNARVSGVAGSIIEADGALALGDLASPAGFNFGGELHTKQFAVTLNASGPAKLGSLTTLGDGANAGTLNAANGFVVDFGDALTGFGTINSTNALAERATINGTVQGDSAGQPITLSGYIKGVGTFNNVTFTGTYSPGLSPTIATVGSITLAPASSLLMEVGGTTAGSSYDQIQANGTLSLSGTLLVSLINGFNPAAGNSFDILEWGSLSGTFSSIQLPTLAGGLQWNTSNLYTTGVLSIDVAGIPGDFNHNGIVDAADYVVWRKGLGATYTQSDYDVWRARFGQTAGSGASASANAAAPEPATAVLLILAAAGWFLWRRRGA